MVGTTPTVNPLIPVIVVLAYSYLVKSNLTNRGPPKANGENARVKNVRRLKKPYRGQRGADDRQRGLGAAFGQGFRFKTTLGTPVALSQLKPNRIAKTKVAGARCSLDCNQKSSRCATKRVIRSQRK